MRYLSYAGVIALTAAVLGGVPTAAQAADPLPDLQVSFDRDPSAGVNNSGDYYGVYVGNQGDAVATGVTLTVDLSKLSSDVIVGVPDWSESCKLAGKTITCVIGNLDLAQVRDIPVLTMASKPGAKVGDAGEITAVADAAEDDAYPENDSATFPVTIVTSGPDLVVATEPVSTEKDPVGAGDTRPLHATVGNQGDSPAVGGSITLSLPTGSTVVERYSDCKYTSYYPKADQSGGYVYGPGEVTCPLPTLDPGDELQLFDPATGESAFTLTFGRNLSGPEQHLGSLQAALAADLRVAKGVRQTKGTGPGTFKAKLKKITKLRESNENNNYADISFWSKPNTIDIQVTSPPVVGAVGDTADLTYEVDNLGPSDGGGPIVYVIPPTGTELVVGDWCVSVGSSRTRLNDREWRCVYESEFPTVHSGYGRIKATVKLKITGTPGTDGIIRTKFCCVASTESNPENNSAAIVFAAEQAGTGGGTGGGGLPVTGTNTTLIAGAGAAVVLLGVLLAVLVRRRRTAFELPQD